MIIALTLALAAALPFPVGLGGAVQEEEFKAPAEAGLRQLPLMLFVCGDREHPLYSALTEYSEERNSLVIIPQDDVTPKAMSPANARIGSARITEFDGGAYIALRPVDITNVELTLTITSKAPPTATLSLDGGRTRIDCKNVPRAPKGSS